MLSSPAGWVSSAPIWSTIVTASGFMPGTEEATRLTIEATCASDRLLPACSFTMTEADGAALSRTKTLASGMAR